MSTDTKREIVPVTDASDFSMLLDTARFDHLWRVASMFARSTMVPDHFKNKPENCLIATQMALRCGVDPMMMMQNSCVVHGKPGMEAKLQIALLSKSGRIVGSPTWSFNDAKPLTPPWGCTCRVVDKATGEVIEHTLLWSTVLAEKWLEKTGSKWKTDPHLMMHYRSATRLIRLHYPDVLMGMYSTDELEEMNTIELKPTRRRLTDSLPKALPPVVEPEPDTPAVNLEELWHELESALDNAQTLLDVDHAREHILSSFPPGDDRDNASALIDSKWAKMEKGK